ncbi:lipopolysaccharide biosynthesis protein [Symbioplanes lichenis]|uniref:lipopolysaccharide biosynthesis protein n=1 Tax=Symbioplanes lichenis TaxID=1629072 RepID=UPI00273843C7|nr:hypothetical protein [Actinoplanes lichenis]
MTVDQLKELAGAARRDPAGELARLWANSLIRNALQLMSTTVATAGLGYVFWLLAARLATPHEVGLGAGLTSVATAVSVAVHLGGGMVLVERLPRHERTGGWWPRLLAVLGIELGATVGVALATAAVLGGHSGFAEALATPGRILVFTVGAVAWTGVNVLSYAFISLRRAGRGLAVNATVSAAKILIFVGSGGVFTSWALAGLAGLLVGAVLLPRWGVRPHTPPALRREVLGSFFWHHLTSCAGVLVPLLLPVLVVMRVSAEDNAYFYTTWMLGGIFLTVSQSVSSALFAEGSLAAAEVQRKLGTAARLIAALLAVPVLLVLTAGAQILHIFGPGFAERGALLLFALVGAAVPDGVTSLAVAVLRVRRRLRTAAHLNLAMSVVTLAGAWFLLPRLGIVGAGLAFLAAQSLGALAVLPFLLSFRSRGVAA